LPHLAAAQQALVLAQQEANSPAHQAALAAMSLRGGCAAPADSVSSTSMLG
jgi:hypothetical protein